MAMQLTDKQIRDLLASESAYSGGSGIDQLIPGYRQMKGTLPTATTYRQDQDFPDDPPPDGASGGGTTGPLTDWMGQYPEGLNATDAAGVSQFNQTTRAPGTLSVKMPDGTIRRFDQINEALNQALTAGGRPLDGNNQPMNMAKTADGGWTANKMPLNQVFGMGLMPGQQQALNTGTQTPYTPPGGTGGGGTPEAPQPEWGDLGVNELPNIDKINLGQMPGMNEQFSPQMSSVYWDRINDQQGFIGGLWDQSKFPTMDAAQMDLAQIPNPQPQGVSAKTPGSFDALEFLLSGQGFDPATLSKMRANATDTVAATGAGRLSSSRLAAQRANLLDSGAGVALQDQAARTNQSEQNAAMNTIDIQNALQGAANRVTGAGLESQRLATGAQMENTVNLTNAQQANLMALQAAQNILQGMQQNTANVQQANQTNFAGDTARATNQAQNQGNAVQSGANAFNQGSLNQAQQANSQNATAGQNWALNQAQLDRSANASDVDWLRNNFTNANNALVSLYGGTNPTTPAANATQAINLQNPVSPWANVFANVATGARQ